MLKLWIVASTFRGSEHGLRPVRRVQQSDVGRQRAHEWLLDFTDTRYLATKLVGQ